MPIINCAATLAKRIRDALVTRQADELATTFAGKSVVRDGRTFVVAAVNPEAEKIIVIDMAGVHEELHFRDFFDERVVIVKPNLLFQPLKAEEINASWVG